MRVQLGDQSRRGQPRGQEGLDVRQGTASEHFKQLGVVAWAVSEISDWAIEMLRLKVGCKNSCSRYLRMCECLCACASLSVVCNS